MSCDLCEKTFWDSTRLRTHVRLVHHTGSVQCTKCGKDVKAHFLKQHMRTVHGGEGKSPHLPHLRTIFLQPESVTVCKSIYVHTCKKNEAAAMIFLPSVNIP